MAPPNKNIKMFSAAGLITTPVSMSFVNVYIPYTSTMAAVVFPNTLAFSSFVIIPSGIAIIVFIAKFFKRISMIDSTTIELAVIVGAPIATAIIVIIKYILHQGNKLNTTVTRTTALEKHDEEFAKKLKEEIEKAYLIHVKQFESTHAIEVSIAAIKARLDERLPPRT